MHNTDRSLHHCLFIKTKITAQLVAFQGYENYLLFVFVKITSCYYFLLCFVVKVKAIIFRHIKSYYCDSMCLKILALTIVAVTISLLQYQNVTISLCTTALQYNICDIGGNSSIIAVLKVRQWFYVIPKIAVNMYIIKYCIQIRNDVNGNYSCIERRQ